MTEYSLLSHKAFEHALRYVSQKSKAITKSNTLPELINRKVSIHNSEERVNATDNDRLLLNTRNNFAPLSEVVFNGRPTFLFGEIGSGKSTLVGQYCIELFQQNRENISLLIPAKFFFNKLADSIVTFSDDVSDYVNKNIFVQNKEKFDLIKSLNNKIEITLIIDGFDELDRNKSQVIILRLEELAEHWTHIRVLATGRPIELQGINYSNWQCLELTSISDEEQELLLYNEAISTGMDVENAKKDAHDRFKLLKENNELLTIATSPLVIRLLRPYLNHHQGNKSLGELLYIVSLERLGNWSEKEGKEEKIVAFKTSFPDSLSRELLLGKIAALIFNSQNKSITKEALHTLIRSEVKDGNQVVYQACEYFINNVLQDEGDVYVFPSQPLFQCALGLFILNELMQQKKPTLDADPTSLWREYSFAASIAKRKSVINDIRPFLQEYITGLLSNAGARAPVAIIIAESGDHQLATSYINYLRNCEFRPIYYYAGFKSLSANSYALCVHLAQENGFEWFYENYLDPTYPYTHTNDEIADSIFQSWLLYRNFGVTNEQVEKLSKIIEPSLVSKSWKLHSLIPTLSLAIPDCFQKDVHRLAVLNAKKLTSNFLRERAIFLLKELFKNGYKKEVLNALENTSNSTSAQLWLELCDGTPPNSILRTIIESWLKQKNLLDILKTRIGSDQLINILRWYVLQQDKIAAHSATILHHFGETNLFLLGKGLLQGLHDGGKVQGTEEILHKLIKEYGNEGLRWIVNQFPTADSLTGAHSAYWRILIEELNDSEESFPNYLYFASRFLGEFILPRYPDIRRSLAKLLANKPEYREELYLKGLRSLDNKVRYNIACILITCSPKSESEAADFVIRSTLHGFERAEWNRFCMRLSLGHEVQKYIHDKLKEYIHVPKVFALMLLHHNNYKLSDEEFEYMVVGLLTSNASSFDLIGIRDNEDNTEKVLALPEVKDILIKQLENENKQIVKESASALWNHHQEKLTIEQLITCWVHINVEMNYWSVINIEKWIDKFINDSELTSIILKIEKKINRETIVGQYLRSYSDEAAWKDILWSCLFTTSNFNHQKIEYSFLWLLNKGKQNKKIADIIGSGALQFLENPSINTERMYNTAVPWLAFLAHEFGNLTNEKLEYIIHNFEPIGQEITCALIARLGFVPTQYETRKNRGFLLPELKKAKYSSFSYEDVVEITRDAEEINENYIVCIEAVITKQLLNNEELKHVATKSRFGGIFTSIIEFCRGNLNNYDSLIHSIGMEFTRINNTNNDCARKVVNILEIIRSIISTDVKVNNKYFESIISTIKSNNHEHILLLFGELIENKQHISNSILPMAIEELVSRPYLLDMNLAFWFSNYLAKDIKEEQKDFVISELKKAVLSLNSAEGKISSIRTEISKWMFSLAVIYLEDNVDFETERLFLTALSSLFIEEEPMRFNTERRRQFKARDILNSVYPLLEKISSDRLHGILQRGITSDIPEINSCCRILLALAGSRY